MKHLTKQLAFLFFVTVSGVLAQDEAVKSSPGYVDFGNLAQFENSEMVAEVVLGENLLKVVSKFTQSDEPELSALVGGLKLIKVNAFEVNADNRDKIKNKINAIDKQLIGKNWDRIVRVRDREETAYVYIKTTDKGDIEGLVVLAIDEKGEAAFVNIVGKINLEAIGKLGDKFDIPSLDKINQK